MTRKLLHQPFFPRYTSSPPSQAPTLPPLPPPSFPKYPFSSSTSTSSSSSNPNSPPFFPLYPSPPPPSLPTFPANISSLITSSPSHAAPHPSKLIPIISLPILAFALLCLIASFFFVRRKRSPDKGFETGLRSDSRRLVPPNATSSSSSSSTAASSAKNTSEFLRLGTLANPKRSVLTPRASGELEGLAEVADSPELCPLPPLTRQVRRSFSSDEEFYSPEPQDARPKRKKRVFFLANFEEPFEEGLPPPRKQAPPPPPLPVPKAGTLRLPVLAPPRVMGAVREGNVGDSNGEEKFEEKRRSKLKPSHWDKVRASSERAMVWDHLQSGSFQFNEEIIETLFGCDSGTKGMGNGCRRMWCSIPRSPITLLFC